MDIDVITVHSGGYLPGQQRGADVQMVFQHQEVKAIRLHEVLILLDMPDAGHSVQYIIANINTFVLHINVRRISDFKIHNKTMNQSQYERLKLAFTTYNTWRIAGFVAGDNQSQSHLMTMLSVHVEIFSTMPPPDLSCSSCVQDMMKRLYEQTNYTIYEKSTINGSKRVRR